MYFVLASKQAVTKIDLNIGFTTQSLTQAHRLEIYGQIVRSKRSLKLSIIPRIA